MDLGQALQVALKHLESGAPEQCLQLCGDILAGDPGQIHALYLRGCAAYQTGDIARSVSDLETVRQAQPQHLHAAYYLGRSLRAVGRPEAALAPLQAALGETALEILARYELANCLTTLRRRPEAIVHYRAILALQPSNAQVAANLAALLERENRLEEADKLAVNALKLDPANETALMARATLDRRNGKFRQAAQLLRELVEGVDNPVNRSIAWNQLGQCLEGLEDWDQAFEAFSESNRIVKTHHPGASPDPRGPHGLDTLARIRAWLQGRPLAGWNDPVASDGGGIAFLVGFPRSATTLLDRMLSAHPDIEVLEEKSLFAGLHQDWSAPGTLESLAEVNQAQIVDARGIYRSEMARHLKRPDASLVIDKLPLNLAYLFLIHLLFPNAPVIFLQRHPLDACLSCFFQSFELQASMVYFLDLGDTVRYYDAVMQVADLSFEQVGNPVHSLRYEDLVADSDRNLRALTRFLGLEWSDAMLDYHQQATGASSNTPSYQQVTQPLHTRSIGKWRHYAKHIAPFESVLRPWIERFGYE